LGKREPESLKGTASAIFAGLAESYERALDWATMYQDRRWKRWVARQLGAQKGDVILDVGSGTLVMEEALASSGCKVVALDLSPEMTRVAKNKGAANVWLLNGDAEALPFSEGAFDGVVSCYVPKYVDVKRFAAELSRVARPGARVVVYDFARPRGGLAPFLDLYTQGGLRLAGLALSLMKRAEAVTFLRLPRIIWETRWDGGFKGAMEAGGFESVAAERLTGGTVYAYCGVMKGRLR
jgi:demethylmenaquinone methyltransferase/2-methoxy-6-polyprenyl-1,4-benzoquinol methylase